MNPNLAFQKSVARSVCLAVELPRPVSVGERDYWNFLSDSANSLSALLESEGIECGPAGVQAGATMFNVLLFPDRCIASVMTLMDFLSDRGEPFRIAVQNDDGTWRTSRPEPGQPFELVEEINVFPSSHYKTRDRMIELQGRIFAVDAKIARHALHTSELSQLRERLEKLKEDVQIGLVAGDELSARLAGIEERLEALGLRSQ